MQVGVQGEVRRPALYELKGPATVGDLVGVAGGLLPKAYPQRASLSRINERRERVIEDLDLQLAESRGRRLRPGDLVSVPSVLERIENVVRLEGHVLRPGPVEFRQGMRLSDLIPSLDQLLPMPDGQYVLIRRELPPDRRVVALSANLEAALQDRRGPADVALMANDQVRVFDLGNLRPDLEPLIGELRQQASLDQPAPVVRVGGRVRAPGVYPLEPGMRVSALLRAGGRLSESAYVTAAEVTRYAVVNGEYREIGLVPVDLAAIRAGTPEADVLLQPYDFLNVREVTDWREQVTVTVQGEVRFPGTYPIRRGERLLSVLERAGGMTDLAFPEGAVFTRVKLRQREEQQIRELADRLETDLAALSLQQAQTAAAKGDTGAATLATGRALLSDLRRATPIGRLALDLPRILLAGQDSAEDVVLEDGDVLLIPGAIQSVTVLGEVFSPTSQLYRTDLARDDYINLSGGMTRRADAKRVYVVHANGQVSAAGNSRWFRSSGEQLRPGDTIVVPADVERMRALPLWTSVTQILYNVAVSVAAVGSL
jgi:protein involved in polysaccharide export with SLBB domain